MEHLKLALLIIGFVGGQVFLFLGLWKALSALPWIRKGVCRLFDWVSYKLERAADRALAQVAEKRQAEARVLYRETVVLVPTPDRPADPWMEKVKAEIEASTGSGEAVNYPRGS